MTGGLYIENGVLYDRQSLRQCRLSVVVHFYTFTRPRGKFTTCDYRKGEVDLSVQLYSKSVLIAHINCTLSVFV